MTSDAGLVLTPEGDREIRIRRIFDAPRHLVFEALTRPELLQRWLGVQGGWSMAVCEIDLRVGGAYRYVWRGADGKQMGMRGVFREIVPPERLVATGVFDQPWYPGEELATTVLVEQGGRTTLTTTVRYESPEARATVLKSPMEKGLAAGYDRLAELVAAPARNLGRSAGALLLGFVAVVALSLGTDQLLHGLDVYPPWGQPMRAASLNFLALSYRTVYGILGSYIAARFAPRNPMRHAMTLGGIGFVLSVAGAIAATRMDLGPLWYPIALVATTLPGAWLGGLLHRAGHGRR